MSPTFRLQSCTAVLIKSEAALTALNWNSSSPRDTLNSKCCSCPASRRCRSISAIAPTNVASSCVATIGSLGGIDHRKKAAGNATPAGHQDLILSVTLLALESCECGKIHLDHVSQTRCILFFVLVLCKLHLRNRYPCFCGGPNGSIQPEEFMALIRWYLRFTTF